MDRKEELDVKGGQDQAALFLSLNGLLLSAKVLHYQTGSWAKHKQADRLFNRLLPLVDRYLEVYQGLYGKLKLDREITVLRCPVLNVNDGNWAKFSQVVTRTLQQLPSGHPGLANVRDEMLSVAQQLGYLLTFE